MIWYKEYTETELAKIEAAYYDSDDPDDDPTLLLDLTSKDGRDMGGRWIEDMMVTVKETLPDGQICLAIWHVMGRNNVFVGPMSQEHFSLVEEYSDYILEPFAARC